MKVTRVKLWMFRVELEDGRAFTVNRRGDVWAIGYEGCATASEGSTLHQALSMFVPHPERAIDDIVELLVIDGLGKEPKEELV